MGFWKLSFSEGRPDTGLKPVVSPMMGWVEAG